MTDTAATTTTRLPVPRHALPRRARTAGVLVFDGAMGTNIQRHNLTAEDFGGKSLEGCNDHLVLTRPDVIQAIHESFLAVGCDVVETCTFQSTPHRLEEWGHRATRRRDAERRRGAARARRVRQILDARQAALRRRLDRTDGHAAVEQRSGALEHRRSPSSRRTTTRRRSISSKAAWTCCSSRPSQDILEVKAAIAGFERLFAELGPRVPVQAQVTLDTSGRMLLGTDIASAMTTLEALHDRRDRPELLDGPGAHARADPLPRDERDASDVVHSERGAAAQHGHRATRSIRSSRSRWPTCSASSSSSSACGSSAGAAGRARSISTAIVERWIARRRATGDGRRATARNCCSRVASAPASPSPAPPRLRSSARVVAPCARSRLRSEPEAAAHRRARQRAGLAQGEAAAARRRLRRRSSDVAREQVGVGRARARRLRRASPSAPTKPSRWRRSSSCSR